MIQRKQTIYLLLALVAIVACMCLPIGHLGGSMVCAGEKAFGEPTVLYNLGVSTGDSFKLAPLPFAILVIVGTVTILNIFMFNKRRMQGRICLLCVALCLTWYAWYALYAFSLMPMARRDGHMDFAACLPFVSAIFMLMARRGIKADEELIKSMDRIR